MISIEKARVILKDNEKTDKEIEETIESLQLLVELMFDKYTEEQKELRVDEKVKTK